MLIFLLQSELDVPFRIKVGQIGKGFVLFCFNLNLKMELRVQASRSVLPLNFFYQDFLGGL